MRYKEIKSFEAESRIKVCGPPLHECRSTEKVEFIVDFKCLMQDDSVRYVEAKGFVTPEYKIKRRLFIHHRLGILEVWGGSYRSPQLLETVGQ